MIAALVLINIQNDYFPQGVMELIDMTRAANNAERLHA